MDNIESELNNSIMNPLKENNLHPISGFGRVIITIQNGIIVNIDTSFTTTMKELIKNNMYGVKQ